MPDRTRPGVEHPAGTMRNFFRNLIPNKGEYLPWRTLLPRGKYHWFSVLLLWTAFLLLLGNWIHENHGALFDPLLQNDDVRLHLFSFHRYTPERALADDPLALDYLSLTPPGIHALYALLVPRFGMFVAPKIVQGLCYLIILAAVLILIKSKHGGLACGLLLGFCVFHTPFVYDRIAGGLHRAFGFPLLMLWCAGAVGKSERLRFVAVLLSSLTYPTAMLLMLAAEGLLNLKHLVARNFLLVLKKCARLFLLICVCLACFAIYSLGQRDVGRLPTLEEARENPAFHKNGRTQQLPFPRVKSFATLRFFLFFKANTNEFFPGVKKFYNEFAINRLFHLYMALPAALALLFLLGRWRPPAPYPLLAFFLAALLLYVIACVFAFRLFLPERYIHYGMPVAATLLTVTSIGLVMAKEKNMHRRATARNFMACALMAVFCLLTGNGAKHNKGMNLFWNEESDLYKHVQTLPPDAFIAGHPEDLDSIPFWTGRAVPTNVETTLPLLSKIWDRQKHLFERSLDALYATNRGEVIAFADAFGVTHLLVKSSRYGPNFNKTGKLQEPFAGYFRKMVEDMEAADLALADIPEEAVVYSDQGWVIVEIGRLRDAWSEEL